ncbi:hypothetical protein VP01_2182g1 [Puccinia sorghi]|uniref:Uncharacterized protein n=1 Tax=Puccinia sorghi TaxID=27349 RepID=A0A0L6V9H6_9BASI|nr:hypothetical protein VP01_2182g1 [Puccinia sorghi]
MDHEASVISISNLNLEPNGYLLEHITSNMFQDAIQLWKSCNNFCRNNSEAAKYQLSSVEWDQASNVIQLLLPLSKATDILYNSNYPSLNPAEQIFYKFEQYLLDTMNNPA